MTQYNSDTRVWSSNARLNVIHHPLSDLFLAFNNGADPQRAGASTWAVALKVTQLLAF